MAKSLMHWLKWPPTAAKLDVQLLKITEVDDYYRGNPFILTGYRAKTTFLGCLKSLLVLHNETINIWSHLLGFLFFVGLFWRDILFVIPAKISGVEVTQTDFFVLCTLIICYQVNSFFKYYSFYPRVYEVYRRVYILLCCWGCCY
jgi:predicted membrane channel-forming protein YqfA (hemolysin III family)